LLLRRAGQSLIVERFWALEIATGNGVTIIRESSRMKEPIK
jgi:hypothetical protein